MGGRERKVWVGEEGVVAKGEGGRGRCGWKVRGEGQEARLE
jgi:hypothetical protein